MSGATLAAAAGIWVEDSIPLFTNSNVTRSDNGIIVKAHISGCDNSPHIPQHQGGGLPVQRGAGGEVRSHKLL